ncbi:MAG: glutamine-hydrolyzing GMP synthase [Firmicutes bacterium]|nr:glutamine-hydrolyzing GMP synthase [Bacillota bacterium]
MAVEMIVVLDFGTHHSQSIARNIRDCQVYSEIMPWNAAIGEITAKNPAGIILSGAANLDAAQKILLDSEIYNLGIPILGIGSGMAVMLEQLGGRVETGPNSEAELVQISDFQDLFWDCAELAAEDLTVSGGIQVQKLPPGFKELASGAGQAAAAADRSRRLYGVWFDPDAKIIENFVLRICGCSQSWTMDRFIAATVEAIRRQVGDKKVVCGLSGGIDSSVAAVLVHKAVGPQLTCIFVDNGLMRKNEAQEVSKIFSEDFDLNLVAVDASEGFLSKLAGVTDPEQKRKIIGTEFIRVFEAEAKKLGDVDFLVQGTLYPDVIESGVGQAAVIKSHHNVGGLPDDLQFELIEPLRQLFKDEVRMVAQQLGLPESIVFRHPFPGPGLGVRVIGEITKAKLEILREADAIFIEELRRSGWYRKVWQALAVLTDTRTVGMLEEDRTYDHVVALRAVNSEDGMTADWIRLPYDLLERVSTRILHEVKGVNRVVYDISSKPPATIEWE